MGTFLSLFPLTTWHSLLHPRLRWQHQQLLLVWGVRYASCFLTSKHRTILSFSKNTLIKNKLSHWNQLQSMFYNIIIYECLYTDLPICLHNKYMYIQIFKMSWASFSLILWLCWSELEVTTTVFFIVLNSLHVFWTYILNVLNTSVSSSLRQQGLTVNVLMHDACNVESFNFVNFCGLWVFCLIVEM